MPPWLLSTVLIVVQFDLSFETCSRYLVAWARSQLMRTRLTLTGAPKSSVRFWSSVKPLLQRVLSSWSMAAFADRSTRSEALAVARTGVKAVPVGSPTAMTPDRSPLSLELVALLLVEVLPPSPEPHPASKIARAQCSPNIEPLRKLRSTWCFIGGLSSWDVAETKHACCAAPMFAL